MVVTREHLNTIHILNAASRYVDAQAVYDERRTYLAARQEHEHYWSFWRSCGFGGGLPDQGIKCFICEATWEGIQ